MKSILLILLLMVSLVHCRGQKHSDEKSSRSSIEEKQKQHSETLVAGALPKETVTQPVDFKYAASKVTPGVVHVNSTWKQADGEALQQETNPFKDFFGEEFPFKFFGPFGKHGPLEASASGVIVTHDGYIITNNHVIDGADNIEVVLSDQQSYPVKIVGSDADTDIALLKIDANNLSFIPFGNSDNVEVGEWVLAVGNPFNLASTVTAAIVSAKARNINILNEPEGVESFIQTDAAVNPGNSGGALVNLKGELIGINTAIATPTGAYAGYSFAVPVNIVKKVANDLMNHGVVHRGYLGVAISDMTTNVATQHKVKFIQGVYVDSVIADGAAMSSGVKVGDIITRIDNSKVTTSPELHEIVAKHAPNDQLSIILVRGGEEKNILVTLREKPIVKESDTNKTIHRLLGIEVEEISEKDKKDTGVASGLKVVKIEKGKVSDFTTMKTGFIITRVDGKVVKTKSDLIAVLKDNRRGGVMIEGTYPGYNGVVYFGFGI